MTPKFLILPVVLLSFAAANAEPPEWSGKPDYSIEIKTLLGQMKYNINEFEAEPGAKVKITLKNDDDLQHNLLVLDQDPKDKDGIQFATDVWMLGEKGIELQWIPPNHKRVLAAGQLLDPHATTDIYVVMPEKTGDYPFVCTVPGHTLTMKGKIKVRNNRKLLTGLKYKVYEGRLAETTGLLQPQASRRRFARQPVTRPQGLQEEGQLRRRLPREPGDHENGRLRIRVRL